MKIKKIKKKIKTGKGIPGGNKKKSRKNSQQNRQTSLSNRRNLIFFLNFSHGFLIVFFSSYLPFPALIETVGRRDSQADTFYLLNSTKSLYSFFIFFSKITTLLILITHVPKVRFSNYDSVEDFNFYIYEMGTIPPCFLHQISDLEIIFHSPQSELMKYVTSQRRVLLKGLDYETYMTSYWYIDKRSVTVRSKFRSKVRAQVSFNQ